MDRFFVTILGAALCLAAGSLSAAAQPAAPPDAAAPTPRGHGFMARFQAANTAGDGRLTLDQARAGHMPMIAAHFAEIDTGGRGYVTLADIAAWRRAHRPPRDPGQNTALPPASGQRFAQREGVPPPRPDGVAPAPGRQGARAFLAKFHDANTTGDGRLTQAQAQAGAMPFVARNFDAIDQGHRGYVTLADIRAYFQQQRGQRDNNPRNEILGSEIQPPP